MTPSEAALKAADIIAERGLAKGQMQAADGRVCHNGAICLALNGRDDLTLDARQASISTAVIIRSGKILRERGVDVSVFRFNDLPETSAEDVILLLKENAYLGDE